MLEESQMAEMFSYTTNILYLKTAENQTSSTILYEGKHFEY